MFYISKYICAYFGVLITVRFLTNKRSCQCKISNVILHSGRTSNFMGTKALVLVEKPVAALQAEQAVSDDLTLLVRWLHGRALRTQVAYRTDIQAFLSFVHKPIRGITLGDLQAFQDAISGAATSTQSRKLSAVKSLLSFGHKTGYLEFNPGAAVKAPAVKNTLAERILDENDVQRMLALESNPRNRVLLRLLYLAGLRISEACGLTVRDLQPNGESGQITVFGKGGKTRVILLKPSIWKDLLPFRSGEPAAPLFRSRQGENCPLDPSQVHRIVKKAALRAGLSNQVSAHWLRHAHASHALDHGAPIHLVQAGLGHASLTTTSKYTHARPNDSSSMYLVG